jgi:hypothetical protein
MDHTTDAFEVPNNFSISDAVANFAAEIAASGHVPCICWAVGLSLSGEQDVGAPTLGGFLPHQVPKEALRSVNGIELVFALYGQDRPRFDDKVMDFDEEHGFFLREA